LPLWPFFFQVLKVHRLVKYIPLSGGLTYERTRFNGYGVSSPMSWGFWIPVVVSRLRAKLCSQPIGVGHI
jgi:hypothetical protein